MAVFLLVYGIHLFNRKFWAGRIEQKLPRSDMPGNLITAFEKNTSIWRSIFHTSPLGWNRRAKRKIRSVIESSGVFVQKLNDSFANPSGSQQATMMMPDQATPEEAVNLDDLSTDRPMQQDNPPQSNAS